MELSVFGIVLLSIQPKEDSSMIKIALAVAATAAVLTTAPLVTPADAQGVKMAQVDVQIGRDRDRDWDRDRRRDRDATVGIGPGGIRIGPRERCRMVTTTAERGGRMITRRERICD
jgi:Ni/Co efflux regulator RcnB